MYSSLEGFELLLFSTALLAVVYPYTIYPAILWAWSRAKGTRRQVGELRILASFTVLIPARNEALVIAAKLENTLQACRATGLPWQIVVVSDASTDRTCELVRSFESQVKLVELPSRTGIVGAFRAGLAVASGDVVVFSDADIMLAPDTLAWLLKGFETSAVGGVCGRTSMVVQSGSGLHAEKINVFLRSWVREKQSDLYSSIGADGANWAIRRELIRLPEKALLGDDLVIPLEVIHQGFRYLYEPRARAVETSPESVEFEFRRKVRTIKGGLQAALQCPWMFSWEFWPAGFHYLSWKVGKHLVPVWVMVLCLVTGLLSLKVPLFRSLLIFESSGAILILICGGLRRISGGPLFVASSAIWYLFIANLAAVVAIVELLVAPHTAVWAAAPRAPR